MCDGDLDCGTQICCKSNVLLNSDIIRVLSFGVNIYRPQRSCGKVMFSQACVKNSVHTVGDVCLSACWDTPSGRHPPPPGQTSPGVNTADGAHPTGMHSCGYST